MKILEIRTIQCLILKTLFESLKEIIFDVNIYFTNKNIKIMRMDHSHSIVVILDLDTSKFEYYQCGKMINNHLVEYTEENPLIIGLNILYLYKLLKNITNNDILSIGIDDNNLGFLEVIIENTDKNIISKYNLSLIDLNIETLKPKMLEYNNIISINTNSFLKLIKEMSQYAKILEIKCYNKELIFSCNGEYTSQETTISEKSDNVIFLKSNNEIYQSYYTLKNLLSFSKFSNLCSNVKLYFRNEFPLLLEYQIGNLGKIHIYISQTTEKK
jgi:proliferating cell nuclear antigen